MRRGQPTAPSLGFEFSPTLGWAWGEARFSAAAEPLGCARLRVRQHRK